MKHLRSIVFAAVFVTGPVTPGLANLVANGGFEAYTNVSAAVDTAAKDAIPASWIETGLGGHTFIGDQFGGYQAKGITFAETDEDPQVPFTAWLTAFDQGIYQVVDTTVGTKYLVDVLLGQFAPEIMPTIQFSAFDGAGIAGSPLTQSSLVVDADQYGDGEVSSVYVWNFTAASDTSTVLFTLQPNDSSKDEGVGLDGVMIAIPEPGTALLFGVAGIGVIARRRSGGIAIQTCIRLTLSTSFDSNAKRRGLAATSLFA